MPRRRGIQLVASDISHVRILKPLPISTNRERSFYSGKIYLRKNALLQLWPGIHTAQRVFLKKMQSGGNSSYSNITELEYAKREVALRNKLKKAGLPVLPTAIVQIPEGKDQGVYLATPPFLRKGNRETRIIPVNERSGPLAGRPYFLARLKVPRDARLIRDMARETATMYNHDVYSFWFDFYGFYPRKDGTWGRLIMDTDELTIGTTRKARDEFAYNMLATIAQALGGGENRSISDTLGRYHPVYQLFARVFKKNLRPPLPQ